MGVLERLSRRKVQAQATTGVHVVDRLGRRLEVGDLVVTLQPQPGVTMLRIVDIAPQLDPSGPRGSMVKAVAEFTFSVPVGSGPMGLLRVKEGAETFERPADGAEDRGQPA